jgi:hypothetical protein
MREADRPVMHHQRTRMVPETPVDAWRRIVAPEDFEEAIRLKKSSRGQVYRLVRSGDRGSVIAKRCRQRVASLERIMAEEILSPGALRSPEMLGFGQDPYSEDEHQYFWVFLEDLGPHRHDPSDRLQRASLAAWLGAMAVSAAAASRLTLGRLPRRDVPHYRHFLDDAISGISRLPAERRLGPSLRHQVEHTVRVLATADQEWTRLESLVDSVPEVVVHGDCLPKNIHVVDEIQGIVVPIDWGAAGLGLPGVDLGISSVWFDRQCEVTPDLDTYADAIRPVWPEADAASVLKMAFLGRALWAVKLLSQSVPVFVSHASSKVEAYLRLYSGLLDRSVAALARCGAGRGRGTDV